MLEVRVGQPVEITEEQREELQRLGWLMMEEALIGRLGWFHRYLRAHQQAHGLLKLIFQKAQERPANIERT